jgi:hypothetical protein
LKVIVANDVIMDAYRQGLPADGKLFPEGSKIADSDDLAQVYRFDLAQDSEMISPTITILMSPGA